MASTLSLAQDLMPPPFSEGFDDWSSGDGTPESPTYSTDRSVHLVRDPDLGCCLELALTRPVQRLRYMGEVPILAHRFIEVSTRLKATGGRLPEVRIAARPGAAGGVMIGGLPCAAAVRPLRELGAVLHLVAIIGTEPRLGVDLVWDSQVLYAHVGLDLLGAIGATVRIENISVRDVTDHLPMPRPRVLKT